MCCVVVMVVVCVLCCGGDGGVSVFCEVLVAVCACSCIVGWCW